jgi:hypothetical protein
VELGVGLEVAVTGLLLAAAISGSTLGGGSFLGGSTKLIALACGGRIAGAALDRGGRGWLFSPDEETMLFGRDTGIGRAGSVPESPEEESGEGVENPIGLCCVGNAMLFGLGGSDNVLALFIPAPSSSLVGLDEEGMEAGSSWVVCFLGSGTGSAASS